MLLTILLWLPLATVLVGTLFPTRYVGWPALSGALGTLGISVWLIFDYSGSERGLQHVVDKVWISQLGIHYKLGIDGLNLLLVALTALLRAVATEGRGRRRGRRLADRFLHAFGTGWRWRWCYRRTYVRDGGWDGRSAL